jgi:hypothetical protein
MRNAYAHRLQHSVKDFLVTLLQADHVSTVAKQLTSNDLLNAKAVAAATLIVLATA